MILLERAYDIADENSAQRFLVDRLWPRGIRKQDLRLEAWLKEVAPSAELRKWFGHDPEKWSQFQRRYFAELDRAPEKWKPLFDAAKKGDVTLIYSASDSEHNNAVALRAYLTKQLRRKG